MAHFLWVETVYFIISIQREKSNHSEGYSGQSEQIAIVLCPNVLSIAFIWWKDFMKMQLLFCNFKVHARIGRKKKKAFRTCNWGSLVGCWRYGGRARFRWGSFCDLKGRTDWNLNNGREMKSRNYCSGDNTTRRRIIWDDCGPGRRQWTAER